VASCKILNGTNMVISLSFSNETVRTWKISGDKWVEK
jgi:hypothetical protein